MNRTFQLVFNKATGVVQVASELTTGAHGIRGRTRRVRRLQHIGLAAALSAVLGGALPAHAQVVVEGDRVIDSDTTLDDMIIGRDKNGSVTITGSADVIGETFDLGINAGVSGTLNVLGTGTTLTGLSSLYSNLYIGNGGSGALNVLAGAQMTNFHFADVGYGKGSSGTVAVDGNGSLLSLSRLSVGRLGSGSLRISNGGVLRALFDNLGDPSLLAGEYAGSAGVVDIDGAGSRLESPNGAVVIGDAGAGTLRVNSGGVLDTRILTMGSKSGSAGTADIGNGSSVLLMRANLGVNGNSTLTLHDNAALSARAANTGIWLIAGDGAAGNSTISVDNSTIDSKGGSFYLGWGGKADMQVRNGAKVAFGAGTLGLDEGSTGKLTVTGAGSSITSMADTLITVGDEGFGTFEVLDGATANVGSLTIGDLQGSGRNPKGAGGALLVSGAGSALTAAGEIKAADSNYGAMVFEKGAQVSAGSLRFEHSVAGGSTDIAGLFAVRDAGTRLATAGEFQATAHFSLTNGASLETGSARLLNVWVTKPGESAVISGTDTRWTNAGDLYVTTPVDVVNGAQVSTGTLSLGPSSWANTATPPILLTNLSVRGAGSRLTTTGDLNLGVPSFFTEAPGYLVLADGGTLQAGGAIRLAYGGGMAIGSAMQLDDNADAAQRRPVFAAATAPGQWNQDAPLVFVRSGDNPSLLLNHTSSDLVIANPMRSDPAGDGGRITSVAGTTRLTGTLDELHATLEVLGGRLVVDSNMGTTSNGVPTASAPRLIVSGGELVVNGQMGPVQPAAPRRDDGRYEWISARTGGVLGGRGTLVGDVAISDGGHLAPGDADAQTLTIAGHLDFGMTGDVGPAESTLDIDILGNGVADKVVVTGKARLANVGSANAVAVTALDPAISYQNGQTYTILTADQGVEGTFARAYSQSAFIQPVLSYTPNAVILGIGLNAAVVPTIVDAGQVLTGNGTHTGLEVRTGGTVAPGTSAAPLGVLQVTGAASFATGSFYDVDIRGDGSHDRLQITGPATLNGGTVRVTALDPHTSYRDGQSYPILSARDGLTGRFSETVARSAFLAPSLTYTGSDAILAIGLLPTGNGGGNGDGGSDPGDPVPPTPAPQIFDTVAQTGNQIAVARALNSLPQRGDSLALYNRLLMLDAPQARDTFNRFSGQVHAANRSVMLDDRFLRDGVGRHLDGNAIGTAYNGVQAWVGGDARNMRLDGDGNADNMRSSRAGVVAGVDWSLAESILVGIAAGTETLDQDIAAQDASASTNATHAGLYASSQWGRWSLRAGANRSWYDVDTRRSTAVGTTRGSMAWADYKATATTSYLEASLDIEAANATISPYLAGAYTRLRTGRLVERGGDALLQVESANDGLLTSSLGVRALWLLGDPATDATHLRAEAVWQHASGDLRPDQRAAFLVGGDGFAIHGAPLARNAGLLAVGLDVGLANNTRVAVGVQGRIASGQRDVGTQVSWNWRF